MSAATGAADRCAVLLYADSELGAGPGEPEWEESLPKRTEFGRRLEDAGYAFPGGALHAAARRPGRYQLQAAIALLHGEATTFEETDWPQIALLYDPSRAARPVAGELLEEAGQSVAAGDAYERALALAESAGASGASDDLRARVARLPGR